MFLGFLFFVVILVSIFFTLFFLTAVIPYWVTLAIIEKVNPQYFEEEEERF